MQGMKILTLMVCATLSISAYAAAGDKTKDKVAAKPAEKQTVLSCPQSVDVGLQELKKKVPDWRYFNDGDVAYALETVSIYHQNKTLEKLSPSKGTESFTEWKLNNNGKEKYFVVCAYSHTSVLLKQQIDAGLARCRLNFEPDPATPQGPPVLHKMTCE